MPNNNFLNFTFFTIFCSCCIWYRARSVLSIPRWSAWGVSCDSLKASLRNSFGKTNH